MHHYANVAVTQSRILDLCELEVEPTISWVGSSNYNSFGYSLESCCLLSINLHHFYLHQYSKSRLGRFRLVPAFKVHNEFILPSEKEGFIHRLGDIIKRAESLMAKGHPSGHRLTQPAFHSGANSLSSSQVGNPTPQC